MTVAEIKEYIDKQIADIEKDKYYYNDIGETVGEIKGFREIEHALYEIKSMLDELEPNAKWTNNMNGTFTCSKCGAKRPNDNYCGNCGAKMEVEE